MGEAFLDTGAHDNIILIAAEEEECVMAKISKQAESHEFNRGFVFYLQKLATWNLEHQADQAKTNSSFDMVEGM